MANTFASDAVGFEQSLPATGKMSPTAGPIRLFKSIVAHLSLAHQRRIDAEVGQFITDHGGQLTDDIERQISRRFGTHAGQW